MLEQGATSRANRRRISPRVQPEDFGRPSARVDEAEKSANRGCLAGAVRPEEPEDDAGRHLERERIERSHWPEVTRQVIGANRVVTGGGHALGQLGRSRSTARTGAASSAISLSGSAISSYEPTGTRRR